MCLAVFVIIATFAAVTVGYLTATASFKGRRSICVLLLLPMTVLPVSGCVGAVKQEGDAEESTKTVAELYAEAYANTSALESYSMEAEISLRKLVFEAKVSGIVKKQDGVYTGSAILKIPGRKYNYEYVSPYNGKETCTELRSEDGNKYLSFNIASIGEGVIRPLPEEIVDTGEFVSRKKGIIEFSVTDGQANELYGPMIEYFKESAAEYIDLSDMYFTSGTIDISIENEIITDYTVTLKADSRIGKLTCGFHCTVI